MNETIQPMPPDAPRPVVGVLGPVKYEDLGITDSHNHVWISAVPGAEANSPVLDQYTAILAELNSYRETGGSTLLDCQPGGFGRDANKLQALARASGVQIIACTGFHRRRYAPRFESLWTGKAETIARGFIRELTQGMQEHTSAEHPTRAGFIKLALEAEWDDCPHNCLEAAVIAARERFALVEIHTERGALAERACTYFLNAGLVSHQLVFCHMDKRPDLGLHKALADTGVALEYDTFFRPKYDPAANLWPLLDRMVEAGYADRLLLATDMAEASQYHSIGGGPGLASFPREIRTQLSERGYSAFDQRQLLGGNIARRLAGLN